ncbi:MAG TPA: hypothetical protein VF538_02455 [Pyrinomonadaceae bacterium]|jgi:hypothetical protein
MRHVFLIALVFLALLLGGCSFATDFVVVNKSEQPIEVAYRVAESSVGPVPTVGEPLVIAASRLGAKGGDDWKELSPNQYKVDLKSRTITVVVMPNAALRLTYVRDYGWDESIQNSNYFPIKELNVTGARGGIKLTGRQVHTTFSQVSEGLYTLTYI